MKKIILLCILTFIQLNAWADTTTLNDALSSLTGIYKNTSNYIRITDKIYGYRIGSNFSKYTTNDSTPRKLFISHRTTNCANGDIFDRYLVYVTSAKTLQPAANVIELWKMLSMDNSYSNAYGRDEWNILNTIIVKNNSQVSLAYNGILQLEDENSLEGGLVTFCSWLETNMKEVYSYHYEMTPNETKFVLEQGQITLTKTNNGLQFGESLRYWDRRAGSWGPAENITNLFF